MDSRQEELHEGKRAQSRVKSEYNTDWKKLIWFLELY